MVDEEIFADGSTGMDVDSCLAVGIFRHDAWNKRNFEKKQFVCDAVDEYRIKSRIWIDYLVLVVSRRVTVVSRLNIGFDKFSYLRYPVHEFKCDLLGFFGNEILGMIHIFFIIAQNDAYLADKFKNHILDKHTHIISESVNSVILISEVTGENYFSERFDNILDSPIIRVIEGFDLVDGTVFHIVTDNIFC